MAIRQSIEMLHTHGRLDDAQARILEAERVLRDGYPNLAVPEIKRAIELLVDAVAAAALAEADFEANGRWEPGQSERV